MTSGLHPPICRGCNTPGSTPKAASVPASSRPRPGADRLRRGEVNALGRVYAGIAARWQFHPLWVFANTLLVNANDPSALWVPALTWSTGNNSEILLGAQVGLGQGLLGRALPRSEYDSVPDTLFLGLRKYL